MAKLNFKESVKQNMKKAKSEIESDLSTPADDIFAPNPSDMSEEKLKQTRPTARETRTEEQPKETPKRKKAPKPEMKLAPAEISGTVVGTHPFREVHLRRKEMKEQLYLYQTRLTKENKYWLQVQANKDDCPMYESFRKVIQVMLPKMEGSSEPPKPEDLKQLSGSVTATMYLSKREIESLQRGAKQMGIRMVRYIDRLLREYREEYDDE